MDTNKIDFKKIWVEQEKSQTNLKEFYEKIELMKKSNIKKNIFVGISLLATVGIIGLIGLSFQPKFLFPKIGMVLIIFSILFF